jgi:arylesterase/paraoxonase
MSPWRRAGLTVLVMCLCMSLFLGFRYVRAHGAFESVDLATPGLCRPIAKGLIAQDLEIDPTHNLILVSGTKQGSGDGLYRLKLDDPAAPPVKLAGTSADFHPAGISLYRGPDGAETLMTINHHSAGAEAVDIFSLSFDGETPKLAEQIMVRGRLLVSPHDLAAVSSDRFYLANDHVTEGALGRFAEDYLLWPHDDVLLFSGTGLRIAVQRIASARGALVTPDGRFLYVTTANDRRLLAFNIEPFTGNLSELGALDLPAQLGDMSRDPKGNLLIAGSAKPGSAQVFRVHLGQDGVPQSFDTVFSDDGRLLKGASSAAAQDGHLFVVSSADDHIVECAMN